MKSQKIKQGEKAQKKRPSKEIRIQNLESIKEYYSLTTSGWTKAEAYREAFNMPDMASAASAAVKLEQSELYIAVAQAAEAAMLQSVRAEFAELQRTRIRSTKKLLNKGDELIDQAATTQEAIEAQKNQRQNLALDITPNWAEDNRNQTSDFSDTLEGVIL